MQKSSDNPAQSTIPDWKALFLIISQPKYFGQSLIFSLCFLILVIWTGGFQVILAALNLTPKQTIPVMLDMIISFLKYFSLSTPILLVAISILQGLSFSVFKFIRYYRALTVKYLLIFMFSSIVSFGICTSRILADSLVGFESSSSIYWSEAISNIFLVVVVVSNIYTLYVLVKKSVTIMMLTTNNKTKNEIY